MALAADVPAQLAPTQGVSSFCPHTQGERSRQPAPDAPASISIAPQFETADDVSRFEALLAGASASPPPTARDVAKAFIRAQLGIDGDGYVFAHFATPEDRAKGKPDHSVLLTDAVMEAFPDHSRHGFFAAAADGIGGLMSGGSASQGLVGMEESLRHSKDARHVFATAGRFLWSRTGPGYLYNTFLASGNVVETVREDGRPLDEAFGIYRACGFTADHATSLVPSQLVARFGAPGAFAELPYVTRLNNELRAYWDRHRADWPVLARYEFVRQARHARDIHVLSDAQYQLVMRGGAPQVPLTGPITLAQLRDGTPAGAVNVRRFDINGYAATDLLRFIDTDGSEVLYIPGATPSFVVKANETALREWVLALAKTPKGLDFLLSHFSTYDGQDGTFWTGVKHGLENIGNGGWHADGTTIDHANEAIAGDVFEDMRVRTEKRVIEDAGMQASTAWEAWRITINRTAALLGPLGFVPPLAIPVMAGTAIAGVGTGVEQAIDGRTAEERAAGIEQTASTLLYSVPVGGVFNGMRDSGSAETPVAAVEHEQPTFVAPQRYGDRIGYLLGPTRPVIPSETFLWRDTGGRLWRIKPRRDVSGTSRGPDVVEHVGNVYVRWKGTRQALLVVSDNAGYRIWVDGPTELPRIKYDQGMWQLDDPSAVEMTGTPLARHVPEDITRDAATLHHAARMLHTLGAPETLGPDNPLTMLAIGHGFVETYATRVRGPGSTAWSARERQLVQSIPTTAAQDAIDSNLILDAVHRRWIDTMSLPESRKGALKRLSQQYHALSGRDPTDAQRDQLRQAAREFLDPSSTSSSGPADAQPGPSGVSQRTVRVRTAATELERIIRGELQANASSAHPGPDWRVRVRGEVTSLFNAAVTRSEPLTDAHKEQLRAAAGRIPPAPDAAGGALAFTVDDVVRTFESGAHWTDDEANYWVELLQSVIDEHDALLPPALDHLRQDPAVPTGPGRGADGRWTSNGREYVQLENYSGDKQVVETRGAPDDSREIVARSGSGEPRSSGWFLVEENGRWMPTLDLHGGFSLFPTSVLANEAAAIAAKMSPHIPLGEGTELLFARSIPQPLWRLFGESVVSAEVDATGAVKLKVESRTAEPTTFSTHLDQAGQPVPAVGQPLPGIAPVVLPAGRSTAPFGPMPRHAQVPAPSVEGAPSEPDLPVSAFIERGAASAHIRALMGARRIRAMVREDTHMVVAGSTPDHIFTLIMPVNADTLAFAGAGTNGARRFADLPQGTIVVDHMLGVAVERSGYATEVHAATTRLHQDGMMMKRADGTTKTMHEFRNDLLNSNVQINLWNPASDPISEVRYVQYLRRRYTVGEPVRHAGLDWLQTRQARRDYMAYFSSPYDIMPGAAAPAVASVAPANMGAADRAAANMHELAMMILRLSR